MTACGESTECRSVMRIRSRKFVIWLAGVFAVIAALYSISLARAYHGQVIDAATGMPLEGVYVIGVWDAEGPFKSGCANLDLTQTAMDGRYSLPSWSRNFGVALIGAASLNDYYHKHAYQYSRGSVLFGEPIVMAPDTRSREEQLTAIFDFAGRFACGESSRIDEMKVRLFQALYEEAAPLANTSEEKRTLDALLF